MYEVIVNVMNKLPIVLIKNMKVAGILGSICKSDSLAVLKLLPIIPIKRVILHNPNLP